MGEPQKGDLRVWWVPQMPMASFNVDVPDLPTANILLETLANYDAFQFENNVKPDYCNAGGLIIFDGEDWVDWWDDETGMDFDEIRADPTEWPALLKRGMELAGGKPS